MPNLDAPPLALKTPADTPTNEAARLLDELRSMKEDIHARFQQVDGRLQRIDGRFQQIDGRLMQIDGRFLQMDGRFLQIKSRLQRGDEKIDKHSGLLVGTLVAAICAFVSALMALYVH